MAVHSVWHALLPAASLICCMAAPSLTASAASWAAQLPFWLIWWPRYSNVSDGLVRGMGARAPPLECGARTQRGGWGWGPGVWLTAVCLHFEALRLIPYASRKLRSRAFSWLCACVAVWLNMARSSMYAWQRSPAAAGGCAAFCALLAGRYGPLCGSAVSPVRNMFMKRQYVTGLRGQPCLHPLVVITAVLARPYCVLTVTPVQVWRSATLLTSSGG